MGPRLHWIHVRRSGNHWAYLRGLSASHMTPHSQLFSLYPGECSVNRMPANAGIWRLPAARRKTGWRSAAGPHADPLEKYDLRAYKTPI